MANVFIPRESAAGESRVSATPETVKRMVKEGLAVAVEAGAGGGAHISDGAYESAGARISRQAKAEWSNADVVLKVAAPGRNPALGVDEATLSKEGAVLIGFLAPYRKLPMVRELAKRKVTSLAMELVPRITRAQPMDALSSQANIAGYKAVVMAASRLAKYFPQLTTAAGTVKPARVVIIGAGVAGLQAIATARRLGAVVEVSDIRPEVKEEVRSLGGRFIELPTEESGVGEGGYAKEMSAEFLAKQKQTLAERVAAADVVITTALVPGKPAPKLLTADMVKGMRSGSVVVDLAVEQGGNCELSKLNQDVVEHGVLIMGYSNLPGTLAEDASHLYARNVWALLQLLIKDGAVAVNLEDEVVLGSLLTHQGEVKHGPTAESLRGGAAP